MFLKRLLPLIMIISMLCGQLMTVFASETGVTISYLTTDYTAPVEDLSGKTIILHTNDVHGAVTGYANIAGLKAEFEAKGANVILADAGDYSQGTPYVSTTKGEDAIAMIQGLTFLAEKDLYAAAQSQVNALKEEGTAFANIGVIVIDQTAKNIEKNYLLPVNEETASDAVVAGSAQKIIDPVTAAYGEIFARTETDLNGDRAPQGNRDSETNLGDLITDAMLWSVSKDTAYLDVPAENIVALTNGGVIRAWVHKGDITKQDVNTVLPFGNTIAVVYVTGEDLLEALEASTYCTPTAVGGFPQIAGMEINIDTNKEYDAKPDGIVTSAQYGQPQGRITLAPTCTHANTQIDEAVDATCTESGRTGKLVCVDCGAVLKNSEVVEALDHNYGSNGICTLCGDKKEIVNAGNKDKDSEVISLTDKKSSPKTGDNSNIMLYMIICAAGIGGYWI